MGYRCAQKHVFAPHCLSQRDLGPTMGSTHDSSQFRLPLECSPGQIRTLTGQGFSTLFTSHTIRARRSGEHPDLVDDFIGLGMVEL